MARRQRFLEQRRLLDLEQQAKEFEKEKILTEQIKAKERIIETSKTRDLSSMRQENQKLRTELEKAKAQAKLIQRQKEAQEQMEMRAEIERLQKMLREGTYVQPDMR